MPVYEFYCAQCHTIFNFLSRRVNTERRPACPLCGMPDLERQVSKFAVSKGRTEDTATGMPDIDESKLEQAIMSMSGDLEGMDENDPRQMARFMRRLTEAAGMPMGDGIEEAVSRLERGEDPDKIEEDMGGLLEDESALFTRQGIRGLKRQYTAPAHDEKLYLLEDPTPV